MNKLNDIKSNIDDQLKISDDVVRARTWLEGWICGMCDQDDFNTRELALDYLAMKCDLLLGIGQSTPITTVNDLINHLSTLPSDRQIIVDNDGNTFTLKTSHIALWDKNDSESPVVIYIKEFNL